MQNLFQRRPFLATSLITSFFMCYTFLLNYNQQQFFTYVENAQSKANTRIETLTLELLKSSKQKVEMIKEDRLITDQLLQKTNKLTNRNNNISSSIKTVTNGGKGAKSSKSKNSTKVTKAVILHPKPVILAPSSLPYNFSAKTDEELETIMEGQVGQPIIVDELLKHQNNGFFIECGAFEGEKLSNSLFFELKRNWTGLLVEAMPNAFKVLVNKHRKAYLLNACLSPNGKYEKVHFMDSFWGSKIIRDQKIKVKKKKLYEVQCFPIFEVLEEIGNPKVDYFSLDVEGSELGILKSIPWEKVDIRVFDIEFNAFGDTSHKEEIHKFMLSKGYKLEQEIGNLDFLFTKFTSDREQDDMLT